MGAGAAQQRSDAVEDEMKVRSEQARLVEEEVAPEPGRPPTRAVEPEAEAAEAAQEHSAWAR